jgi:MscS family membrane protein
MRVRFDTFFRSLIVFLVFLLAWSIWAGAQTVTNQPVLNPTNSPSTLVRSVERLEQHGLTFGLDRIEPLRELRLGGEPLWKYLATLVYVLLAFYGSKFIDLVIGVWLKRLAARTETKVDDLLLGLLHGPVKVVAFVVFLNLGLSIFEWSEAVKLYLSKGLIVVVASSLTYLAVKVINLLLDLWRRRSAREADAKFDDQLFSLIRKSLNAFVIVVAVLVTAQNLGINITAAITSLSIGGLAVGLAAQDTLANLFGAVAVFVDRPFRAGDQIKLDGAEGGVESIGLRSTRVRNGDGQLVAIPNKIMGNAIITNISERPHLKTTMNLVLAQQLPTDKVKQALTLLNEIYRGHPMTQDVWISFNRFTTRHINIMIVHWWKGTDQQKYLAGMQELNLAVKERFDAEGISFA